MPSSNRTFRVFVSSTFSDLKEERNALQQMVFPKLRELCMQNGCRFQAIDLRWGVREEAGFDQQTLNICLDEIKRCQRIKLKPNFIVLLGDRYGWRPAPPEIPQKELEKIESHLSQEDKDLIRKWYLLDSNAVPAVFVLQPRIGEYRRQETWELMEHQLRSILLRGVSELELSEQERVKYFESATEQEIDQGLDDAKAQEHVFCFFRNIEGIEENPKEGFVDLEQETSKLDSEAYGRLNTLKDKLRTRLPNHCFEYQTGLTNEGATKDHIDKLCNDVYNSLEHVIQEEIKHFNKIDPLDKEVEDHAVFGEERARFFVGRQDVIGSIKDYLGSGNHQPFAIFGESGSGKTSLMARLAQGAREIQPSAEVVFRFTGVTPSSTDGRTLLESLCQEISRCYSAGLVVPAEYTKLIEAFPKFLALAKKEKPMILFLDALDQLSDADNARNLAWLPKQLPEHIKIVVSCLPGEAWSTLTKTLPHQNLVKLDKMPLDEGEKLLDLLLQDVGRKIQVYQKQEVLSKFALCGLPLYLKLAFEEARLWKSYTEESKINPDIPGIIYSLFNRLSSDTSHGKILVSHALGYLRAARNGLTEDELLDILSVNEQVFQDFKQRSVHEPPEKKLPVIVWSRLYFDLEPYLTERSADDASLITFYHRQFSECVSDKYLQGKAGKYLHQELARYFDHQPTWVDKKGKKPNRRKVSELPYQQTCGKLMQSLECTLSDLQFIEAKCTSEMAFDLMEDYSRLGIQPLTRGTLVATAWLYNCKYGVFCPDCLTWSQISPSKLGHTLNCSHCGSQLRINNFVTNGKWTPSEPGRMMRTTEGNVSTHRFSENLKEFALFVSNNCELLNIYPSMTLQQAANEPSDSAPESDAIRLLQSGSNRPWLRTTNKAQGLACLRVHTPAFASSSDQITDFDISPNSRKIVIAAASGSLQLSDFATGSEITKLVGHKFYSSRCSFSPDGTIIASLGRKTELKPRFLPIALEEDKYGKNFELKFWDSNTGAEVETIEEEGVSCNDFAFSPDGQRIILACSDGTLRLWDLDRKLVVLTINAHKHEAVSCAFSPDGKLVVSAGFSKFSITHVGELKIWDLTSGAKTATLTKTCVPAARLIFSPDGEHVLSLSRQRQLSFNNLDLFFAKIWQVQFGFKEKIKTINLVKKDYNSKASSYAFSPDGNYVATGHENGLIALWSVQSGENLTVFEGNDAQVRRIAFSSDGKYIVSAEASGPFSKLKFWDLDMLLSCRQKIPISGGPFFAKTVEDIIFSPDGTHFLTNHPKNDTKLWDARTRKISPKSRMLQFYSFSPDGKEVLAVDASDQIATLDTESLRRLKVLSGHMYGKHACTFSPNERFIAVGTNSSVISKAKRDEQKAHPLTMQKIESEVSCELKLFDTKESTNSITLFEGKDLEIDNLVFLPDSSRVIAKIVTSFSIEHYFDREKTSFLRIWETVSGKEKASFTLWDKINEYSFSPDSKKIVVDSGGEAKLLDAQTGVEVGRIADPDYSIQKCAFIKDGDVLSISKNKIHEKFEAASRSPRIRSKRRCPICNKILNLMDYVCPDCGSKTRNVCQYCGESLSDEDEVVCKTHWAELSVIPRYEIARWKLSTQEKLTRIPLFEYVAGLGKRVSPNCLWIAFEIKENILQVSDLITGNLVCRYGATDCINAVAWAPDNHSIAVGYRNGRIDLLKLENMIDYP